MIGDLLATQALDQGVAAMLVDGAVRDLDELRELGLPIWARFVRAQGATKQHVGELDTPVVVGGAQIDPGDVVVLDADGAVVVKADRVDDVVGAALEREAHERDLRARYAAGERSYDVNDLRRLVEGRRRGDAPGRRARPRRGGRDDRLRSRRRGVHRARLGPRRRIVGGGVERTETPTEAVAGADLVLSLATAAHAVERGGERRVVSHCRDSSTPTSTRPLPRSSARSPP